MIAYVWRHNVDMCATPALQHPAARQATAITYAALTSLLGMLPLATAGAAVEPRGPLR